MAKLRNEKSRDKRSTMVSLGAVSADANDFIPAPKLRAKLGISAVTLWRWRHDDTCRFPAPKVIKGRLYFPLAAVSDWLARQPGTV